MCGICGVVGNSSPDLIETMVTAILHRGPDDQGVFHNDRIALGMARLAILDLSPAGHQPMATPDGNLWIVFNGEIYNFQSERDLLEKVGYEFRSTSDTEVILRMYEHYGDDFLSRLRGMFALAIYDQSRDRLLIARDQMGIKPLLYTQVNGRLIFASELKSLLATGLVEREINPNALRQLLTFGSVIQPETMLKDVHMLLPAHRMIVENGHTRIERYWQLGVNRYPELGKASYEEQVDYLEAALEESVRLQMVSDVPLGAFLSGGVDSSILVALMSRSVGDRLKTFSVGFEADGQTFDESHLAQTTADYLGTDHTSVMVQATEVRDAISHIAAGLDQPSIDGVNTYFVSRAARQGMTVAISGTGGDELFAGYPRFWQMVAYEQDEVALSNTLLAYVARQVPDQFLLKRGGYRLQSMREQGNFLEQYALLYHIFGAYKAAHLLSSQLREAANAGRTYSKDLLGDDELAGYPALERVTALCLRGYTTNQLLRDIDATSMSHSLEVRVPYLDPILADIALSLPASAKLKTDIKKSTLKLDATYGELGAKRILVDVSKRLLPTDFSAIPKRGFILPFASWMSGALRDVLEDTLSDSQLKQRNLFNFEQAVNIRETFLRGEAPWTYAWLLMMIELWHREVLDSSQKIAVQTPHTVEVG